MRKLLTIVLIIIASPALADRDSSVTAIYNYYTAGGSIDMQAIDGGTAIALASRPAFSGISKQWQFSLGAARYRSATALAMDVGKKFCDGCPVWTFSVSTDFKYTGYSGHVTFKRGGGNGR